MPRAAANSTTPDAKPNTRSPSRTGAKREATPAPPPSWDAAGVSDALLAFLERLEARLEGRSSDGGLHNPLDDGQSRFSVLAQTFALTAFERAVLMLGLIAEAHPLRLRRLAAAFHDAPDVAESGAVTRHLALSWFDGDPRALTDDAPLLRWQLMQRREGRDGHSLAALTLDPSILAFIFGDDRLNPRLARYLGSGVDRVLLSDTQRERALEALGHLQQDPRAIVQLHGRDARGQAEVAHALLPHLGRPMLHLNFAAFLEDDAPVSRDLTLWARETQLHGLSVILEARLGDLDVNPERWPTAKLEKLLASVVAQLQGPLVLLVEEPLVLPGQRPVLAVEVQKPTRPEQRQLWVQALGLTTDGAPELAQLTDQFDLNASAIGSLAQGVKHGQSGAVDGAKLEAAWEACRLAGRQKVGRLAERLAGNVTWDDLILPPGDLALIQQVVEQVRHRAQVYEAWGMGRNARGLGISALFSGPSGTGKTLAAEVIASALKLDLYRIDLSSMVSKYIGETEKNLKKIFDAADDGGVILLFDEADSLFGKRGDVKDAHDRYANIQVNYLLQRMESYSGLAVLTTNLESSMDVAFMRRIRFVLNFRPPEAPERKRIWLRAFPPQMDLSGVDFDQLAQVKLAGGNIRSVALTAAFMAAARGERLSMEMLQGAITAEWRKLGRLTLNDRSFDGWGRA